MYESKNEKGRWRAFFSEEYVGGKHRECEVSAEKGKSAMEREHTDLPFEEWITSVFGPVPDEMDRSMGRRITEDRPITSLCTVPTWTLCILFQSTRLG
jgi:hypothetical protein